ncbi:MAG: SusE domain-containing protein [Muribaculaceae bacterium]|nr:SusE domain-containing protein [Muribaculaceae bacterium]
MKKIFHIFAITAMALGFASCDETWDDNPVLKIHEGVITADFLNEPVMQEQSIMLTQDNGSGNFHLTCSQPDFGYAAIATYKVQVSLSENFNDYREITQAFYDCAQINPVNSDMAAALEYLSGVQTEADLPLPYQTLYVRLRSFIAQDEETTQYLSNVVKFSSVSADYLAIWVADVPVDIYLRGGMSGWDPVPDWRFVTGSEENTWVIKNVTIPAGTEFKVADPNWGDMNYGSADKAAPNEKITLEYNGDNITMTEDFSGLVQLSLEQGVYYLTFDASK